MINNRNTVWRFIWHYVCRCKIAFGVIFLGIPVSALCLQLIPWYTAQIVSLVNSGETAAQIWSKLIEAFFMLMAMVVVGNVLQYLVLICMQYKAVSPMGKAIQLDLFSLLLGKGTKFWRQYNAGDMFAKINQSRRSVAAWSSLGTFVINIYGTLCTLVVILALLAKISSGICLFFTGGGFLLFWGFFRLSQNMKQPSVQCDNLQSETFGKMTALINHFFLLKIFGSADYENKRLGHSFDKLTEADRQRIGTKLKNELVLVLLSELFKIVMVCYAVSLWIVHEIEIGSLLFVFATSSTFVSMLTGLCHGLAYLVPQYALLDSNLKIFNSDVEIKENDAAKALKISNGQIEIKNLTFAYNDKTPVLKNISLSVKAGEKVGIVGLSGGGKTTLLHLIQRIENTPEGTIFIDGQDITQVTVESLHKNLAFIPQDTSLFHRSLKDNLRYGAFWATAANVKRAAHVSYVDEFAKALPQKYETLVGDKGVKLSGGQRQRVGIARALLKNAPILLLDEATSALDSESETFIQQALEDIIKDKTVLVVAHRLSTLRNMDRIIVLSKGKIVEDGTADALLRKGGKFAKLWNIQMKA